MIRWKQKIRKGQYLAIDIATMILSFVIAYLLGGLLLDLAMPTEVVTAFYLVTIILLYVGLFMATGIYNQAIEATGVIEFSLTIKTATIMAIGTIVLSGLLYLLEVTSLEPMLVLVYYVVSTFLISHIRMYARILFNKRRATGKMVKKILIVGNSPRGQEYLEYMRKHAYLNMEVVGYINIKEVQQYEGLRHLGEIDELVKIAKDFVVDEIAVARPLHYDERLHGLLDTCQMMGITLTMLLDVQENYGVKAQVAMYGTMPTLKFHTVSLNESQLMMKRVLDIIGSAVGLCLFGLAYIVVGPLIKLETPGPVIFKQERVGMNGRVFKIWKFRSMGVNAEKQKAALLSNNEMTGHMFKMTNDPRITKIGAFIRKTSIDELPQFWNVFRGDMSLVGTRPPTVKEVEEYDINHRRRICVTPGITGKWQVSGRSDIEDFEEVVRLDSEYIEGWTILEDIKILLKTLVVVFQKDGSR